MVKNEIEYIIAMTGDVDFPEMSDTINIISDANIPILIDKEMLLKLLQVDDYIKSHPHEDLSECRLALKDDQLADEHIHAVSEFYKELLGVEFPGKNTQS